jgi:hypothetical protein
MPPTGKLGLELGLVKSANPLNHKGRNTKWNLGTATFGYRVLCGFCPCSCSYFPTPSQASSSPVARRRLMRARSSSKFVSCSAS